MQLREQIENRLGTGKKLVTNGSGAALTTDLGDLIDLLTRKAKAIDMHEHGVEFRVDLDKEIARALETRHPDGTIGNIRQRRLRDAKVQQIADDIDSGNAVFSGQSILISPHGLRTDGQHRCGAVLAAQREDACLPNVRVIVCYSHDAARVVDTGTARSLVDSGRMYHGWGWSKTHASAILLDRLDGNDGRRRELSRTVEIEFVDSLARQEPKVAKSLSCVSANLWRGEIAAALRVLRVLVRNGENPELGIAFFNAIHRGLQDVNGTPVRALYFYLRWRDGVKQAGVAVSAHEQMHRAVATWNAWRRGDTRKSVPRYNGKSHKIPAAI